MISWAYIYEHPDADPVADRRIVEGAGQRSILVPVPTGADAPTVAEQLIAEGVGLIELCGAFSLQDAARVGGAVGGRVPLGALTL
jgi:hypothetical protein